MKLGFIGTGNMAGAIMGGVIKSGLFKPEEIIGADLLEAGREKVKTLYGIHVTADYQNSQPLSGITFNVFLIFFIRFFQNKLWCA